jgi:molybdopterin converting factor subunit 1
VTGPAGPGGAGHGIRVRVRLFASYAEAAGRDELDVGLAAGATAADALAAIRSQPWASRLPPSPAVAVNQRYARGEVALHEGDEVAIIPPVAGG